MATPIDQLLQNCALWRAGELAALRQNVVPTGHASLDAELPGGGWPVGGLTEILCDGAGRGEVSLLLPTLGSMPVRERGIIWVSPPHLPYAPALRNAGIDLAQCLVALLESRRDALWVTEQALRSGGCGALLAWLDDAATVTFSQALRLLAVAQAGEALAFLFRPPAVANDASPAVLRISVAKSGDAGFLSLYLLKRRGPPLAGPIVLDVRDPNWPRHRSVETCDVCADPVSPPRSAAPGPID